MIIEAILIYFGLIMCGGIIAMNLHDLTKELKDAREYLTSRDTADDN